MVLTTTEVLDHVAHSLAGASQLSALRIANLAGHYLVGLRNWRWLRGASATVGVTAGQAYAELPADCKRVHAIEQTDSLVGSFDFIPVSEFLLYKTSTIAAAPTSYFGTVVYARDTYATAGTEKPTTLGPRLELFPTPTSTNSSGFTVYYDRGWKELTEDNEIVTIPEGVIEPLYLAIVRAFAKGYEEEDTADVDMRLERIRRGPLYDAAIRADVAVQPHMGKLRGGIADSTSVLSRWSGASIIAP